MPAKKNSKTVPSAAKADSKDTANAPSGNHMERLNDPAAIPLDSHIFIEASAGTGKTYTIEKLILRALTEKKLNISDILAVTFTEKAAGELKERIRSAITREIANIENNSINSDIKKHLEKQLNEFDSAFISTIHSFCSSIIHEYSDLIGEQTHYEITDHSQYAAGILYSFLRKIFYIENSESLAWVLDVMNFSKEQFGGGSEWESSVLRAAETVTPEDRIIPEPGFEYSDAEEIPDRVIDLIKRIEEEITELGLDLLDITDKYRNDPEGLLSHLSDEIQNSGLHHSTKRSLKDTISKFINILYDSSEKTAAPASFFMLLIDAFFSSKNSSAARLLNDPDNFSEIENYNSGKILNIVKIVKNKIDNLAGQIKASAVHYVRAGLDRLRSDEGLLSFSGMLSLVYHALLYGEKAADLLNALRSRFRMGIVDEFQDTDHLQWSIFNEIFIKSDKNFLILVGDPKQAIYAFRGADVYAYLSARKAVQNNTLLCARFYYLPVNYRSQPALISELNKIFSLWFNDSSGQSHGIHYTDVSAPDPDRIRYKLYSEENTLRPVNIILLEEDKAYKNKVLYFNYIADEIQRITSGADGLRIGKDSGAPPEFSDITVLFHTKNDLESAERILRRKGIPCGFYKKPGLYSSDEAFETECLFSALVNPESRSEWNRAMMTVFFRGTDHQSFFSGEKSEIRKLTDKWIEMTERRQWPQFFRSLRTESGMRYITDERKLTNLIQIFEDLEYQLMNGRLNAGQALVRLRVLREENTQEEASLHRKETEKPKVNLMTIHASKGLEFPVVFLATGFSVNSSSKVSSYVFHDNEKKVIDLIKDDKNRERHEKESDAEQLRLLYVALTRAVYRVYFPVYKGSSNSVKGPLSASVSESPGYKLVNNYIIPEQMTVKLSDYRSSETSYSAGKDKSAQVDPGYGEKSNAADYLNYETDFSAKDYRGKITLLDSYSSLKNYYTSAENETPWTPGDEILAKFEKNYDSPDATEEYAEMDPADTQDERIRSLSTLGRGADTGNLIHEILETVPFRFFMMNNGMLPDLSQHTKADILVQSYCSRFGFDYSQAKEEVTDLICRTLNAPLSSLGNLRLCDLAESDYLRETEFYLKTLPFSHLYGFMDLVFRKDGRYWIADWKTDNLKEGYGDASLKKAMTERGYELQYKIYTFALDTWLSSTLKNYSYDRHFGGVFYFFMRGIDPQIPGSGIFKDRPDYSSVEDIKKSIIKIQEKKHA